MEFSISLPPYASTVVIGQTVLHGLPSEFTVGFYKEEAPLDGRPFILSIKTGISTFVETKLSIDEAEQLLDYLGSLVRQARGAIRHVK
jgi:hypothetical protein